MNCEPKTIAPSLAEFEEVSCKDVVVSQDDEGLSVYCDWTKTVIHVLDRKSYGSILLLTVFGNALRRIRSAIGT